LKENGSQLVDSAEVVEAAHKELKKKEIEKIVAQ